MATERKSTPSSKKQVYYNDILNILNFFLNLFKRQIGASDDAPTDFRLVGTQSFGSKYIYELSVENNGKVESRRMSVGPLGEDSGSKSKCYYVIYDDHVVIKIPPTSTTDFDKYIKSISDDRMIVNQLAPKECIVPGVSVILKWILPFPDSAALTPRKIEERYINLLKVEPAFQEYLKIKDSFAFFMDLSKHLMFSDVISKMHVDSAKNIAEEIHNHFANIPGFENRYGHENEALCYDIKNLYFECESEIKNLMTQVKIPSSEWHYKIPEWISIHMADQSVQNNEDGLSQEFTEKLNLLIEKKIRESIGAVQSYRRIIKAHIDEKKFRSNKPQMMGVITNILELIAWLGEKKVAMRDLKPDNLLVIGDSSKYPIFLKFHEEFTLGLIDVETAVVWEEADGRKMKQPQIGGTPFFATPSHLFKNEALAAAFDDLSRVLHFQDWYAAIVMIYTVATGDRLFLQTAMLFPGMKKELKSALKKELPQTEVIKKISRVFWHNAVKEFHSKVDKKEAVLNSVEAFIPPNAVEMFKKEISRVKEEIADSARIQVDAQQIFKGEKNRRQLLQADCNQIGQIKSKWENGVDVPKTSAEDKEQIIQLLRGLMALKLRSEHYEQLLQAVKRPALKLSAFSLLTLMFEVILQTMYREEWGPLSDDMTSDAIS